MEIGIFDFDMISKPRKFYPDLEAMKLSAFHKKNKDLVSLVSDASKYERFNKIYLRKNLISKDYPTMLLSKPNVEFGGRGFFGGKYCPMEKEVENMLPDRQLYESYYYKKLQPYKDRLSIYFDERSSLVRLSSNYKSIITGEEKRIIVYDEELGDNPDAFNILTGINGGSTIRLLYPYISYNLEEVLTLCSINGMLATNMIIYNQNVDKDRFSYLCEKSKELTISIYINPIAQFSEDITLKSFSLLIEDVIKKSIYLRVNKIRIKFYLPRNFENIKVKNFCLILENYLIHNKSSIYDIANGLNNLGKIEILEEMIRHNPRLKILFNITPQRIIDKGGYWPL